MNSTTNSKVSVIIPAYNGQRHIENAMQSILSQTRVPDEIIVIDDGSTDNTAEIVLRFGPRIKYVYKPNGGVASARNEGIRIAEGQYLAFLDQDDWWPNDMLALTLAKFEENKGLEVVMGLSQIEFEEGALPNRFGVDKSQLTAAHLLVGSAVFSRSSFDRLGLFNENLPAANDVDWFNRAREAKLPTVVLPSITLYHRRHADNASNDTKWLRSEMMKAMKLSLDRRRNNSSETHD